MKYSFMKEEPRQDGLSLQDVEYFQSCYPESMKRLQVYVAEECDKMDYKGSPMYDQYPDRVLIDQMCDSICRCIPDEMGRSQVGAGSVHEKLDAYGAAGMENIERYELLQGQQFESRGYGRPPGPPHWGPPPGRPNWRRDLIQILLLNEMQRRRCRNGRCY